MDVKSVFLNGDLKEEVYVEQPAGFISTGNEHKQFKKEMADAFKMSDLGLLRYYLGIEVRQSARGTSISQGAYAAKILERSGMAGCNPCQVLMATRLKLSKMSTELLVDATAYRSIDHLAAVKQILRYVAGTKSWGLRYERKKEKQVQLTGFSDSDFAGDVDARKSTTRVIFFLVDNKSVIALIKNLVLHGHSKHIEVKYHLVRESAEKGQINVEFIRSEEQLGDVLTKPLGKVKFHEFRTKIGLVDVRGKYSKAQEEIVVNGEPCTSFCVTA
ncbi:unnamed protein product [Spirodela intermedia]|uniref:Reverse transcriptase Ty1/copia-type domain-containing protein n=1 Tax=Spirodela intermedia TaxID=51605 RepID=A0ABN7E823_SPIIN|nr:unnamed protein product [Spirodela intermedia]